MKLMIRSRVIGWQKNFARTAPMRTKNSKNFDMVFHLFFNLHSVNRGGHEGN